MKSKPNETLDFLRLAYPEGPWCLSAISPDKAGMETRTFYPGDRVPDIEYDTTEEGCLEWLKKWCDERNLYFHVNPVAQLMMKKADRRDIARVVCFHVDLDAKSQHMDAKKQLDLIFEKLTEKLPKGVPPPTCVIFSGGGFQAFWFLKKDEYLEINGDLARAEDVKRYNQQLEKIFDGDNCHNIDRLMRAPGTLNIPDKKKRERGREPALAKLVFFDKTRLYSVKDFVQASIVQIDKDVEISGRKNVVDISENVKRLNDINDLDEWNVPARVKVIIVQGSHPEEPKSGDNSRSSWLFDAVCNMLRAGVPDALVYSVITDAKFAISDSVLELKAQARRYAIKQITSAKEFIEEPWLAKLNNEYCVVSDIGGKVLIAEEKESEVLEGVLEWQFIKPEEFTKRFENIAIEVGQTAKGAPIYKELGLWWRKHPQRRQVSRMVFRPNATEVADAINLWKGFTVDALPGEKHLTFKNHIRQNICSANEVNFTYLWKWLANVMQNPAKAGQVAIVLKGQQGAGKGFFVHNVGKLLGRHYVQASNPNHITGQFNGHLRSCCLLFADEAVFVGDKKSQSVLKTLITEPTLPIERKGIDIEICPNYVHLIMASNDEHVIRAGSNERRFLVLDVSSEQMQNTGYFDAIAKELKNGGWENLLYDLLTTDLTDFNVWDVPKTIALQEQADLSLDPINSWWMSKLIDGSVLSESWDRTVPREDVYADFIKFMDVSFRGAYRDMTPVKFGILFKALLPECGATRMSIDRKVIAPDGFEVTKSERMWCYILPSLKSCRDYWDKRHRRTTEWPDLGIS